MLNKNPQIKYSERSEPEMHSAIIAAANVGPLKSGDKSRSVDESTPAKKLSLYAAGASEPASGGPSKGASEEWAWFE